MTRTLILLFAVVLLGGVAYYLTANPESPSVADRDFAFPESERIARIFIADRDGHQVSLERGGPTGWTADGLPANENVMKNLLQAVEGITVQSLPASKAVPNLVRNLAGGGILVQLYDRTGKKLRGYYVGGGANGELGTAAIMENSENPYVVHLPMWSGNLRHRFNLRDDDWRSKKLYQADPERVEYLSIEYPKQQRKGFRLEAAGDGNYTLLPYDNRQGEPRPVARGVAEGVLSRFENYYVSRYENRDTASASLARQRLPFAIIRLKEAGREEQVAHIYPRFRFPDTADETLEAYTALINDGQDWALLAVETTQPLLIGYDSF